MQKNLVNFMKLIGGCCMKIKDKKSFKKEKDKKEPLLVRLRLGSKIFTGKIYKIGRN